MFKVVAIASILASAASVASASFLGNGNAFLRRDDCADCAAPVTVTNTVTVTECPTDGNAVITKYITVPCTEGRVSPFETAAPVPPPAPSSSTNAPPPPPPPPPAPTSVPIRNKNITIPEPTSHGIGCPAYGCGTDLPIVTDTSSPSSTFSMPSSTRATPSATTSACPAGGCTSRATANTVGSMPIAVAVLAALFVVL